MFEKIKERLKTKSTASGLNALAIILGLYFGPAQVEAVVMVVGALYGAYDIFRNEPKPEVN